ncbi:MAG: hypothetical protein WDO19_18420 [Bacteroidota bacterium]
MSFIGQEIQYTKPSGGHYNTKCRVLLLERNGKYQGGKCKDMAEGDIYKYINGIKKRTDKRNKALNTKGTGIEKKIMKKKLR